MNMVPVVTAPVVTAPVPPIDAALSSAEIDRAKIRALELNFLSGDIPLIDFPVKMEYTPGLCRRTIFLPRESVHTTRIHKTEHPYVVLQGHVAVFIPGVGVEEIVAPFVGVTKPGTQRVVLALEDTLWVTFHPLTAEEDVAVSVLPPREMEALLESRIIERNELAGGKTAHELFEEFATIAGLRELEIAP